MVIKKETWELGSRKMFWGAVLFLAGLMGYLGFGWPEILMVVGVIFCLKGLFLKTKKK